VVEKIFFVNVPLLNSIFYYFTFTYLLFVITLSWWDLFSWGIRVSYWKRLCFFTDFILWWL